MKNYAVLIFSALCVCTISAGGAVLTQDKGVSVKTVNKLETDQPDILQCNFDLIELYVKIPNTKPEDISKFCPSVEHSCCSIVQLRDIAKEYSDAKSQVVQSYAQIKQLVDLINNIPDDSIRKFVEDWRVVPMKKHSGVNDFETPLVYETLLNEKSKVRAIESDYSRFLEKQFQLISGFACSICNRDHGKDFVVDTKELKIQEVAIRASHCDELFAQNHELRQTFLLSLTWVKIANIVDFFKNRNVRFRYNDYANDGHSFFHNIKRCTANYEHDSDNNLSDNCKLICEKLFSFNSIVIPYRILEALQYVRHNIGEFFFSERLDSGQVAFSTKNEFELVKDHKLSEVHAATAVQILPHKGINYPAEQLVDYATLETASGKVLLVGFAQVLIFMLAALG